VTIKTFSELGLADPINLALIARNHTTPTPIQAQAIPQLLKGRDMLGIAQTGTGKTAAFALPILHQLSQNIPGHGQRSPRALVLAPTRELAIQIGEEFKAYAQNIRLYHTVIFGGVSQKAQVAALTRGVDIIVATPGRLLDLLNQRQVKLDKVEYLVLDEADRMLDMGFVRDVRKIISPIPKRRQSLLFSATMPGEISGLAGEILNNPARVEVTPQSTPIERIRQNVHHVNANDKRALLANILSDEALSRVMVFTRTKHRANKVADYLEKCGINADAIHGNKSQGARQRALKRFKSGEARVLVATDIAARGIDVDNVSHVINFELPNEPENYVHRIGRTARAGAEGIAVAFCDSTERGYLKDIERLIRTRLTVVGDEPEGMEFVAPGKPKKPHRGANGNGNRNGNRPNGSNGNANPSGKPKRRRRRKPNNTSGGGEGQRSGHHRAA
jgi:ATP-dependent RNA helicase RhlE